MKTLLLILLLAIPAMAAEPSVRELQLELRAIEAERDKLIMQFQYAERLRQEAEANLPRLVTRENELKAMLAKEAKASK